MHPVWKKPTIIKTESGTKAAGLSAFGKRCGAYVSDIEEESDMAAAGEDSEALEAETLEGEQSMPLAEMSGYIKSWNSGKGFGFIMTDQAEGDVFFSKTELPLEARDVHGSILEGREVNLDICSGPDGRARATTVQLCYTEGKPLLGVIKSYSDRHRYGFVTSSTLNEDAQFHATDLPPGLSLMGPSLKGQFVTFEVQRLPDSKVRVTKMQLQAQNCVTVNPVRPVPLPTFNVTFPLQPARIQPWNPHQRLPAKPRSMVAVAPPSEGAVLKGTVKSYSDRHGYGFIKAPGQVVDIKFAKADLLHSSIASGASVSFVPVVTPDGRMQARQVSMDGGTKRSISPARNVGNFDSFESFDRPMKQLRTGGGVSWASVAVKQQPSAEMPADGERLAGVVRSFIPSTGFGFITCDEVPGDIYFGRSVMPPDMHSMELSGRMVTFELTYASDGKFRSRNIALA